MNVFARELKANRNSTLIWAALLSTLAVVFLLMFTAFNKDVESAQNIIGGLPLAVRNALNISLKNFFTIYGFFGYLFTFVTLAGAIQAMNLGVGMLSKEVSGKTVDFLLTKPISRTAILTSKLFAAILLILITNITFTVAALATAMSVASVDFNAALFLLISATLLFTQVIFLGLGVLFSVIIPKVKSVVAVTLPTVFTFFIIGMLGAVIGDDNVKYVTPFKFFDPNYIISNNSYEMRYIVIGALATVIAITASYIIYVKKDIRAVS